MYLSSYEGTLATIRYIFSWHRASEQQLYTSYYFCSYRFDWFRKQPFFTLYTSDSKTSPYNFKLMWKRFITWKKNWSVANNVKWAGQVYRAALNIFYSYVCEGCCARRMMAEKTIHNKVYIMHIRALGNSGHNSHLLRLTACIIPAKLVL